MKIIKINQPETRGTVITIETMEVNQKRVFELNELYQRDAGNEAIFGDTCSLNLFIIYSQPVIHDFFHMHYLPLYFLGLGIKRSFVIGQIN